MASGEIRRSAPGWVKFLVVVLVLAGATWVTWFDTYSLIKRARWKQEHADLIEENARLRTEIEQLQEMLAAPPSDELIERIAREQYGMRRAEETVHRLEDQ